VEEQDNETEALTPSDRFVFRRPFFLVQFVMVVDMAKVKGEPSGIENRRI
jgi:hypothetical protein